MKAIVRRMLSGFRKCKCEPQRGQRPRLTGETFPHV
jgi:hypothetical protein